MKPPSKELLEERPCLKGELVSHANDGPPPIGRPPLKYTKAVHDTIVNALRNGQLPEGACGMAGISLSTYQAWVMKGKMGDPHLWQFAEDVEIAMNSAEAEALEVITNTYKTQDPTLRDPEYAKWYLERTRANRYSKQVRTTVADEQLRFVERLKRLLPPDIYQMVVAAAMGQAPPQLGQNEILVLPENAETEVEDDTTEPE